MIAAGRGFGAFLLGGASLTVSLFCVALAGAGLLTTVGVIVAMDTFGPVSDNAQGIAEMSGDVSPEGAQILTELDAVGNTTKAITKGIADRDRRTGGHGPVRVVLERRSDRQARAARPAVRCRGAGRATSNCSDRSSPW